jgi:conjugative relaxase-like TrwC/TraI family protein
MLQITMSKRSDNATRYFDGQDLQEGPVSITEGRWGGKGAARLGLGVKVSREQFMALGNNKDPHTGKRLTMRQKKKRTCGYDMCFSVPKSLSLYLATQEDQKVESMILDAFRETIALMEDNMETRVRVNGRNETRSTGNMIYARFTHREARPVNGLSDPHYHIHCYVFNATFDPVEDRWKAGQFRGLKTDALSYERAFHFSLGARLEREGYPIMMTRKGFELASVSRGLIEKFSKRSKLLKENFKTGKYTLDDIASRVRDAKNTVLFSPEEQKAHWIHQMSLQERESLKKEQVKSAVGISQAMELGRAFVHLKNKKKNLHWAWKRANAYTQELYR